jgi:hypothetical protein
MFTAILGVMVLVGVRTNKIKMKGSQRPLIVVGVGLIIVGILETIQRYISHWDAAKNLDCLHQKPAGAGR